MKKTYILDTNVLLHDPAAIQHFEDNRLVIPLRVLEEIDQFKRDQTELGRNARQVSRTLDALRLRGKLAHGVPLDTGGELRVAFPSDRDPLAGHISADDHILRLAMDFASRAEFHPCIVVSKDINLRLKADALGLDAEDYETDRVDVSELYLGHSEAEASREQLDLFRQAGRIPFEKDGLLPNEYLLLRSPEDPEHTVLARYDAASRSAVALTPCPDDIRTVMPRNKEQHYAMDALLNDDVKLVTIVGKAGTGKTLLAVAAALHMSLHRKAYRRMLVCRPTIPMGKDIGYLPGTLEEKLIPWMQPIYDALDFISNGQRAGSRKVRETLEDPERVGIEPLTYIRGRSIPNQYIVVDEAQNLTPLEAKTVLTRVGPGTKIVLTGDIYQIDNPYVDSMSNGLTSVAERFRPYAVAAHLVLTKGVRSEVAELAANLL